MKTLYAAVFFTAVSILAAESSPTKSATADLPEVRQPHTPTLVFYLTGVNGQKDADAIRNSVQKLKSASTVAVNTNQSYACIRFDSHVVSYHQVAQSVTDAGDALGKKYDPYLEFSVPQYSVSNNAAKVDAIFAGKRLNTRVKVSPLDKSAGKFAIHFQSLTIVTNESSPQGFNGGHLHHPISDPPPRGLGLTSAYKEYNPSNR